MLPATGLTFVVLISSQKTSQQATTAGADGNGVLAQAGIHARTVNATT